MKTYTYEESLKASSEYFGNDLSARAFVDKYALRNEDNELLELTPADMHRRIAKELARIEKKKFNKPLSEDYIFSLLDKFKSIIPQGSPMYGIGNKNQYVSTSNCFVVDDPKDSYAGICKTDQELVQISKRRGGVGVDISSLRPTNSKTHNSSRTSTGTITWMERYSNTIREVGQSGRRGALMLSISVHHPDILDFITVKNDDKKVTGANISIRLTDEFLNALSKNEEYEQRWPVDSNTPEYSRMISSKRVWEEIINSAWYRAEPGLLFWDNILRYSPADCYGDFKTISTNPSLRKGSLVLTNNGVFPIEELVDKKDLIVYNIRNEPHKADCFISGKNKQLYKITFSNNQSIYCTPEHKWPVFKNDYKRKIGEIDKVETKDIKPKQSIYLPYDTNPIDNKECNFTKEDGFVLGWNLGDGWISYHIAQNVFQYGFIFSYEDIESGIGDKILEYCNTLAKRPSTLRQDHDTKSKCFVTTDLGVRIKMSSLNAQHKSLGIPKSVWSGNSDFIKGFIDGLFSSDGYVEYKDNLSNCRIVLVSAHKKLIYDIQKLLCFYGIRSNIKYSLLKEKYHRYDLIITGLDVKKFGGIFSLSNIKKQNRLSACITKSNDSMYKNTREYLTIKSVEKTQIYEDVYDITVYDDTHTFLTECGVTGNCGEIPLCAYDSCRLLAINLFHAVEDPFTKNAKFNFDTFYETTKVAQRLMDDIVDLEIEAINRIIKKIECDPEPEDVKAIELNLWNKIKSKAENGRRTGTGITALGDVLAALNIPYGSEESVEFTGRLYEQLKLAAYDSSIDMAEELGPFPVWDANKEKNNPFLLLIKETKPDLYDRMLRVGRRNIAILTTAPTGTVSMMASLSANINGNEVIKYGTTSGIEPIFYIEPYTRRKKGNPGDQDFRSDFVDQNGDHWMEFKIYHPGIELWMQLNNTDKLDKCPYISADKINWTNRVKLQAAAQKHVDHSISSTINLPNDITKEEVATIYLEAWKNNLKGITVYRDGCRTGVIVKSENKNTIVKTTAPKRPNELECDVYHISVKGQSYFVLVGLFEGEPYEIFAGKNGVVDKKVKKGKIIKQKRSRYKAEFEDGTELSPIAAFTSDEEDTLTRLISAGLRHGADVSFLVHQLEKAKGDMQSFSKSLLRALKKYIPDGNQVRGEECPECSSLLVRTEGCVTCKSCGWSRC